MSLLALFFSSLQGSVVRASWQHVCGGVREVWQVKSSAVEFRYGFMWLHLHLYAVVNPVGLCTPMKAKGAPQL